MSEPDPLRLDEIRIIMDLPRLGELIAAVAVRFAQIRDLEPPDLEGEEMRQLALAGWQHVERMADRADFASSVRADLEGLDQVEPTAETAETAEDRKRLYTHTFESKEEPKHKPEFDL